MRKCPYCAEEIKDEAIKCRYCGSIMPETEHEAVQKEAAAAVAEERAVLVADAAHARGKLIGGYVFCVLGLAGGIALKIHMPQYPGYIIFIAAYALWSLYWGVQIVHGPIKRWYSGLFLLASGVVDLFLRQVSLFLVMYLLVIPVIGLIVGLLGGAIVKQFQCCAVIRRSSISK